MTETKTASRQVEVVAGDTPRVLARTAAGREGAMLAPVEGAEADT